MISSQDGILIDENALFPTPPLDDENEQSGAVEDGLSGVSNISDEYASRKENFQNQVTDTSSQSSAMSREIIRRKEDLFRNVLTDSSSQDSYPSKIKGYSSQTTCSSSQETADTEPICDNDHDVDASMRTCQTISDDISGCDEDKFRLLDTESSQGTHSISANMQFNFRRRESTNSSSSGGNPNALLGDDRAKENSDDGKMDSFLVHGQEFFKITALNQGNIEESKTLHKLSLLERKRSLVDDSWEGINQKEPKLVKYNSIGPVQDFSKMYLRRTSSEGFQIHSEG